MGSVTKKEHYIWRGYLKRWTDNQEKGGKVFIYNKARYNGQPLVEFKSILKMGFQNYYYDMEENSRYISEIDIDIIQQILDELAKHNKYLEVKLCKQRIIEAINNEKNVFEKILCDYENIDNNYDFIEKIIDGDLNYYNNSVNTEIIKMILPGESFENIGEGIKNLLQEDYKYIFLRFFFMQLARTPRFIESYRKTVDKIITSDERFRKVNSKLIVNAIMIIFAYETASFIDTKRNSFIERIENTTEIPFVTGDSPIILKSENDEGFEASYYYPLSPKVAIKLWIAESNTINVENRTVSYSAAQVIDQNILIAKEAVYGIYSNNKKAIETIVTSI